MSILTTFINEFSHSSNGDKIIKEKLSYIEIKQLLIIFCKLMSIQKGGLKDFYDKDCEENNVYNIFSIPMIKEIIDDEYIFNKNVDYNEFVKKFLEEIY